MKKLSLIFCILVITASAYSQRISTRVNNLESEIAKVKSQHQRTTDSLEGVIQEIISDQSDLDKRYSLLIDASSLNSSNLSNQLSALSSTTTIWGIILSVVLAIVAIVAVIFERLSASLLRKNKIVLSKTEETKNDVAAMKADIDGSADLMYSKMVEKEFDYAFSRMKESPLDFDYFFSTLASKDLPSQYYERSINLVKDWEGYHRGQYAMMGLCVQHFHEKIVLDEELTKNFLKNWSEIERLLYQKEYDAFTSSFLEQYNSGSYENNDEVLESFLFGVDKVILPKRIHTLKIAFFVLGNLGMVKIGKALRKADKPNTYYLLDKQLLENTKNVEVDQTVQQYIDLIIADDYSSTSEKIKSSVRMEKPDKSTKVTPAKKTKKK
jgi:hypothetical protein